MGENAKSVAKESNTYDQGKGADAKTKVISSGKDGGLPQPGGNPTKGGGINRATKGGY